MVNDLVTVAPVGGSIAPQADNDGHLIRLWLHGRSPETARAYIRDVQTFLGFVAKPLAAVTIGDVQAFVDSLAGKASASRARTVAAIKSLFAFGQRCGYLQFNVGAAIKTPAIKNQLAERILCEAKTLRLVESEPNARNRAMLKLTYCAALRVSELVALRWRDLQDREQGGQVTVFGKGGKTRAVVVSAATWAELVALRPENATADDYVFPSRDGALTDRQFRRIVLTAARRIGVKGNVSPHWLRHAHASHALDRGATLPLVQNTLGHASIQTTGKYLHTRPGESSGNYLAV